ncbi:MAG: hypothetical protein JWM37_403 [Candidatus Saccharibacteria bacterium]|nr:hypothetical protein [Candidatus Saccharibacteria bacterium]
MINAYVILAIAGPAVLLLFFRSNAALTFLSLCLGSVLAHVASNDASQLLGSTSANGQLVNPMLVSVGLLVIPAILTALFMIKSVRPNRLIFQVLPAVSTGAAAIILGKQYLSLSAQDQLSQSVVWQTVNQFDVLVIGLSALFCLLAIWMQRPKHHGDKEDHHKHGH